MAVSVVGSSVTANQLKDFFSQIADGSLNGQHLQALLEHRNPFSNGAAQVQTTLTIPPHLTILERIALGEYDWKNDGVITNEDFPHDATTVGEWEFDLFHPDCVISPEDAQLRAEVDGWTVAQAEHLLALGQAFPELQRRFSVITLGTVDGVSGRHGKLVLSCDGNGSYVDLDCWGDDWKSDCRFLRVRKVKQSVA